MALPIPYSLGFEISLPSLTRTYQGRGQENINHSIERLGCEIVELNIQEDHVHLLIKVSLKIAISVLLGTLNGKSAIRVFNQFPELKQRPYWGNHFWAEGYCVDSVGLDSEMIKKYVKYQDKH